MNYNYKDGIASSSFSLSNHYEGYNNIIHGGIVAAVLDEAMAKAILHKNIKAVTANLNIDYKKPLKPEDLYIVEGSITVIRKKIILAQALIFDGNTIYAQADAKFFILSA